MNKMTMLNKCIAHGGIYDTRKYRYVAYTLGHMLMRIDIDCIGRTSALDYDNWEIVIE